MTLKPNISLFFPAYKDEKTIRVVVERALQLLEEVAGVYEIIIVDDGSPDRSGEIADELSREHPSIRVIHHQENLLRHCMRDKDKNNHQCEHHQYHIFLQHQVLRSWNVVEFPSLPDQAKQNHY